MANDALAIRAIGTWLPEARRDNLGLIAGFDYAEDALRDKIGILATARKPDAMETSDMCVAAWGALAEKLGAALDPASLDLVVVVTQHPDGFGLPHTSAVVHGKLGLPMTCFAFDVGLGCSGYVASLAIVSGYLTATGKRRAVLFTADPYSKSVADDDKNTAMIFGDAATATLIEAEGAGAGHGVGEGQGGAASWKIGAFDTGTDGKHHAALERDADGVLRMNGRSVFNFCALNVPKSIAATLEKNGVTREDVDAFVLHPGSKYIVDTISSKAKLPSPQVLACAGYGNTISSSVPMMLADLDPASARTVFISGFGVGLGWASCVLKS